jgi:glycerol-3-phosphate dehydrogenase subunit B
VGRDRAALLLGPWLGLERERASELEQRFGVPVGEALAATAATVGIRFEGARATLLAREGIAALEGRATRVLTGGRRLRVELRGADALEADAVVLATGGIAGGGIVYQPAEYAAGPEGADASRSPFRLSLELEGALVAVEGARRSVGSMFGPDLGAKAWPRPAVPGALEHVGVITRGTEVVPRVHAAGDLVAGEPRTMLRALRSGLAAGRAAVRSLVEA